MGRTLYNNGIMDRKYLTVSGVKLSLNDIHSSIILNKFSDNKNVIYGLFQGTIGGPNLRSEPYTGELVTSQLANNAAEFINSNRGTYQGPFGPFRVSSFYLRNKQLFPNFNKDLKAHLSVYLEGELANSINKSTTLIPDIENRSIVNFSSGLRSNPTAVASNPAVILSEPELVRQELADIGRSTGTRYSEYQVRLLTKMKAKASQK